jgi:hypothetical protein
MACAIGFIDVIPAYVRGKVIVGFEVLTAVVMNVVIFWDIAACSLM